MFRLFDNSVLLAGSDLADPSNRRTPEGCRLSMDMVRAGGLEPPRALRPNGFSYQLRLSPPLG